MVTHDQLREARVVAEKATPGPYEWGRTGFTGHVDSSVRTLFVTPVRTKEDLPQKDADCKFVAHFNPQFVLQLLDELERTAGTTGQYAPLGSGAERSVPESLFKMKQDDWIEACHKIDTLEKERDEVRTILAELVELKDMKDQLEADKRHGEWTSIELYDEYRKRKPIAWYAAREALK